jgi:hypothetical protein
MHHNGFNTLIYSWCRTWVRWVIFIRRRRLYECFCVVWNFCRCRCEAKHFEHSYQKTQNQKCKLVYTSQSCVYCVCLSVYCVQVGPTLCTYSHSQAMCRDVSLVATKPSSCGWTEGHAGMSEAVSRYSQFCESVWKGGVQITKSKWWL